MHGWNDGWSWWAWALMTVAMVTFWGLIVWWIVSLARSPRTPLGPPRQSAEESLAERLASGTIDESEYRSRLEVLRSTKANVG